jgi:hypothetical protein
VNSDRGVVVCARNDFFVLAELMQAQSPTKSNESASPRQTGCNTTPLCTKQMQDARQQQRLV